MGSERRISPGDVLRIPAGFFALMGKRTKSVDFSGAQKRCALLPGNAYRSQLRNATVEEPVAINVTGERDKLISDRLSRKAEFAFRLARK